MGRINNYEELVAERRLTEAKIEAQKFKIEEGIREVKEKLEPFLYLLPILTIFKKKESNNVFLKGATSLGIDLVGHKLLSKSGWLIKLLVPLLLKGFSSAVINKTNRKNGKIE